MAQTQNKDKMLELTTEQIEKKFGKGAIMKLGSNAEHLEVAAIPTGALPLDAALGIGGVPRGRIVEIYGPESSGKTTLALQILAEAPLSTPSMPLIQRMPRAWASISTRCSFLSPTRVNRAWKSAICSFALMLSTA